MTHLPHIDRYLTTLPNHTRGIIPHQPFLEVREDLWSSDTTKSLGRFMPDHVGLLRVPQDFYKGWDRVWREKLTEYKSNFMSG